jgi:hypothetical protein
LPKKFNWDHKGGHVSGFDIELYLIVARKEVNQRNNSTTCKFFRKGVYRWKQVRISDDHFIEFHGMIHESVLSIFLFDQKLWVSVRSVAWFQYSFVNSVIQHFNDGLIQGL